VSPEEERALLKTANPRKKWADKVDKMPDGKVTVVLNRLIEQGVIEEGE
jgi:hypothetical protein